jgi:hypothetical protein
LLACFSAADRRADHHQARGDADANPDGSAMNGRLADRSDDSQSSAHGSFGIALASLRPTEID